MNTRVKTETVAEFLARGGSITQVPNGGEAPSNDFVKATFKLDKPVAKEDLLDGPIPNLRWIGGRDE